MVPHPRYFPDLPPCDFFLLSNLGTGSFWSNFRQIGLQSYQWVFYSAWESLFFKRNLKNERLCWDIKLIFIYLFCLGTFLAVTYSHNFDNSRQRPYDTNLDLFTIDQQACFVILVRNVLIHNSNSINKFYLKNKKCASNFCFLYYGIIVYITTPPILT